MLHHRSPRGSSRVAAPVGAAADADCDAAMAQTKDSGGSVTSTFAENSTHGPISTRFKLKLTRQGRKTLFHSCTISWKCRQAVVIFRNHAQTCVRGRCHLRPNCTFAIAPPALAGTNLLRLPWQRWSLPERSLHPITGM